jgi:hypothetical protein
MEEKKSNTKLKQKNLIDTITSQMKPKLTIETDTLYKAITSKILFTLLDQYNCTTKKDTCINQQETENRPGHNSINWIQPKQSSRLVTT